MSCSANCCSSIKFLKEKGNSDCNPENNHPQLSICPKKPKRLRFCMRTILRNQFAQKRLNDSHFVWEPSFRSKLILLRLLCIVLHENGPVTNSWDFVGPIGPEIFVGPGGLLLASFFRGGCPQPHVLGVFFSDREISWDIVGFSKCCSQGLPPPFLPPMARIREK